MIDTSNDRSVCHSYVSIGAVHTKLLSATHKTRNSVPVAASWLNCNGHCCTEEDVFVVMVDGRIQLKNRL